MRAYGIARLTKEVTQHNNVYRISLAENIYNFSTKENDGHFWNAIAFGKTGKRLFNYVHKGDRILITDGMMQNNNYTRDDGTMVYSTTLVINQFEFIEKREDAQRIDAIIQPPVKSEEQRKYDSIDVSEDDLPF